MTARTAQEFKAILSRTKPRHSSESDEAMEQLLSLIPDDASADNPLMAQSGGGGTGNKQVFGVFTPAPGFANDPATTYDAETRRLTGPAPALLDGLFANTALGGTIKSIGVVDATDRTRNGPYNVISFDSGTGILVAEKMAGFQDDGDDVEVIITVNGQNESKGAVLGVLTANGAVATQSSVSTLAQPVSELAPRVVAVDYGVDFVLSGTLTVDPAAQPQVKFVGSTDFPTLDGIAVSAFDDLLVLGQADKRLEGPWYLHSSGGGSYELRKRWPRANQLTRNTEVTITRGRYANTRWRLESPDAGIDPGVSLVRCQQISGPGPILLIKDPLAAIDTDLWTVDEPVGSAISAAGIGTSFSCSGGSNPKPSLVSKQIVEAADVCISAYFKRLSSTASTALMVSFSNDRGHEWGIGLATDPGGTAEIWAADEPGGFPDAYSNAATKGPGASPFTEGWLRAFISQRSASAWYSNNAVGSPPSEGDWVQYVALNSYNFPSVLAPARIKLWLHSFANNAAEYELSDLTVATGGIPYVA